MLAADLALLLLLLLCSAASAGIGMDDRRHPVPSVTVGAFRVKPEFPASRADPCRRLYVTLLPDGALPPGSRYLRLVVDSPGPLGAIAAPLQWAEIGTTQSRGSGQQAQHVAAHQAQRTARTARFCGTRRRRRKRRSLLTATHPLWAAMTRTIWHTKGVC